MYNKKLKIINEVAVEYDGAIVRLDNIDKLHLCQNQIRILTKSRHDIYITYSHDFESVDIKKMTQDFKKIKNAFIKILGV